MNNVIKGIFIFAAGAGVGFAGSYFFLKKKFDKELVEEVENLKVPKEKVKEEYQEEVPEQEDFVEVKATGIPTYAQKNVSITDYTKMALKDRIDVPENVDVTEILNDNTTKPTAHLISVDKYEELSYDHRVESLIYYADGTITDNYDNVWYRSLDQLIPNASDLDFDDSGYLYAEKVEDNGEAILYEVSKQAMSYNEATGEE